MPKKELRVSENTILISTFNSRETVVTVYSTVLDLAQDIFRQCTPNVLRMVAGEMIPATIREMEEGTRGPEAGR